MTVTDNTLQSDFNFVKDIRTNYEARKNNTWRKINQHAAEDMQN